VDAVFSPVRKANYTVENVRVGTGVNMERLVLEVWTDRAISPIDALKAAADTMMQDLYLVTVAKNPDEQEPQPGGNLPPKFRNMRIEDLELTARTQNALRRRGYKLAHELVALTHSDLMSIRGVGKTSVDELFDRLEKLGFFSGQTQDENGTDEDTSAS
jgi:DNA-directed RNA polymerase subunit alpha